MNRQITFFFRTCASGGAPLVSIIIPVYNRSDLLRVAIQSCLDQSAGVEVIVVDDGSKDDIRGLLKTYFADDWQRRLFLYRQENQGACVARNNGLAKARGKYVKFLDSDDHLIQGAITQEVAHFEKMDADVVVTGWMEQCLDVDRKPVPGSEKRAPAPDLSHGIDDMLLGHGPWTSAALYRRDFIQDLAWDPAWTKAQDWGWALTVCLAGARFVSLDIPSSVYCHHSGERITNQNAHIRKSIDARQYFLRMIEKRLREQDCLTKDRRHKLAQYYYRDRIFICEVSSAQWASLWKHCQKLAPGFVPNENHKILKIFIRVLGVCQGVQFYVALKKFGRKHRRKHL